MSKFAQMLQASTTGRRAAEIPSMTVTEDVREISPHYALEYRIGVQLESRVFISDEVRREGAYANLMIQRVKEKLVQEVFGEFREPIHEIRHAIYERDWLKVDQLLSKLHDQMFSLEAA